MTTSALGVDGAVAIIGPRSPACAGMALVVLTDGILEVDPAEPGLLSSLTLHDPDSAADLVDQLVRSEDLEFDASALLLAASGFRAGVAPTADLRSLLRLGLVTWLDRYSPDRLSQFWLDLEIGCRTSAASDFIDEPNEAIRARLLPHVDEMLDLAAKYRSGAGPVNPALSGLVQSAIVVVLECVNDVPRRQDLDHASELGAVLRRFGTDTLNWEALALEPEFSGLDERILARAGHAGADPEPGRRGRSSVDWLQVPRGFLDPAEGTIAWEIGTSGTHIDVEVAAGYRATPSAVLGYRVLDQRGSLVGAGPLTLEPTEGLFRGSGRVGSDVSDLQVDVFDPRRMRPPRTGSAAIAAEAERAAALSVTLTRLAIGGRNLSRAVPALDQLQRSSRLYRAAARRTLSDATTSEWSEGLEARYIQTLQTLHGVADRVGRPVVRDRASATLGRLDQGVGAGSIDTELAAAEVALLNLSADGSA